MVESTQVSYLPEFQHIPREELRKGRNVYAGYQRGWGLQYGELAKFVAADPLYRRAVELCAGRSVQSEPNRMNVFLILKYFLQTIPFGHIIEFGSYKGGSAIFMAAVCAELHPRVQVYALDTFEGMPPTDKAVDAHGAGDFKDTNYEDLCRYVQETNLTNLHVIKGLFENSAPGVLKEAGPLALVHIDCDIRSAVQYSYDIARPHFVRGGYAILDDATVSSCIGATEVVEETLIAETG